MFESSIGQSSYQMMSTPSHIMIFDFETGKCMHKRKDQPALKGQSSTETCLSLGLGAELASAGFRRVVPIFIFSKFWRVEFSFFSAFSF